jgi:hypothetical protein
MCFTLDWLLQMLIWIVIILAIVAILRVLVPWALSKLGGAGDFSIPLKILTIVFWAVVIIAVIIFAGGMISCLLSMGHMPTLLPHGR